MSNKVKLSIMSHKQGQEPQGAYTDNIRVKISERYKPPHRIYLTMTYAQRLALNKQIQDNIPKYDFSLESTVRDKIKEWKIARTITHEERKCRLNQSKEELKQKLLVKAEREKLMKEEEVEVNCVDDSLGSNTLEFKGVPSNSVFCSVSNQNYSNAYSTNNMILMPTQVATNTYTNILTPIPLSSYPSQSYTVTPTDKSPFNISDFENDTTPFDNMELKSINDKEELAQVLKSKDVSYNTDNTQIFPNYGTQPIASHIQPNFNHYIGNQYTYNIPNTMPYSQTPVTPVNSIYSRTNGYYYPPETRPVNQSFSSPLDSSYAYAKQMAGQYNPTVKENSNLESNKTNFRSVPDIVKALQADLENTHLDRTRPNASHVTNSFVVEPSRPKSTDAVYPKAKLKKEDLEDPFSLLPKNLQDVCNSISSMGFPLPRVARACKILGSDQKKIVEHLLALSDLLDLGFPEKDVSSALLQCDNDRDKALDKLIS